MKKSTKQNRIRALAFLLSLCFVFSCGCGDTSDDLSKDNSSIIGESSETSFEISTEYVSVTDISIEAGDDFETSSDFYEESCSESFDDLSYGESSTETEESSEIVSEESAPEYSEEESYAEESSEEISEEPSEEESQGNTKITMSFVGDTMLASYKNQYSESGNGFREYAETKEPEYFLSKVRDIFLNDDFTVCNLECVITDNDLPEAKKSGNPVYWYKGASANLKILTTSGVDAVNLCNNHTKDYGDEGYEDTIANVEAAGLEYGTGDKIIYYTKNGFTVAVVCAFLSRTSHIDYCCSLIKYASKKSDYQILYFHGGTMNIHTPEDWKVEGCRKIVDAGADLILGAHPHKLQPMEVYNGAVIIYSLGNFCYGGNKRPENATIIYQFTLEISEENEIISCEPNIIPCYVYGGSINDYCPYPMTDEEDKNNVLDFMNGLRESPVD